MARFSERYGYREVRTALQQDEMDDLLRTDLWNVISMLTEKQTGYTRDYAPYLRIWIHLWRMPVDQLPYEIRSMNKVVKKHILEAEWFEVYDFIEAFVGAHEKWKRDDKVRVFDYIFRRNLSAYRFVDELVVKIDEDSDVEAIAQALRDSADLTGAKRHLQQALHLLANRTSPDYANSVKESISAVEAVCQHLAGKKNAVLSDGLKALKDRGITIHPALEKSWIAAYGYTSDADGIRHALNDEPTVDQARARYFLVTCSAFVSLLVSHGVAVNLINAER